MVDNEKNNCLKQNDTEIVILVRAKDWTKHTTRMSAEIIKNIQRLKVIKANVHTHK